MVIPNAATGNQKVKALVYIAAYVPDEADTVASLGGVRTRSATSASSGRRARSCVPRLFGAAQRRANGYSQAA
jgi:hypothetical protein